MPYKVKKDGKWGKKEEFLVKNIKLSF